MRCPVDRGLLASRKNRKVELRSCGTCSGLWLELDDFVEWLKAVQVQGDSDACHFEGKRTCPKCQVTKMGVWKSHGIEVDVCRSCRGIWFDQGELEKILRQRKKAKASHNRTRKVDALEFIPDAALEAGVRVIGKTLSETFQKTPDVTADLAAGVFEFVAEIFSALDF